jgi:phosphate transport system substrate-binding protein
MAHISLQNKEGAFVDPTIESFQAAASNADWANAPGFYLVLTDQPGEKSWPITGASFILVHKEQTDKSKAEAMMKFFDFCYQKGVKDAKALHYVPMPENVISMIHSVWKSDVRFENKPIWK